MIQQRTLARKESAGDLKSFGMPIFAFQLALFLNFWFQILGSGLQQKAHFGTHAEVSNDQDGKLGKEGVPAQFAFVICFGEKFFHCYGLNLHNVANIQIVNPLVLVQKAEHAPHIRLLLLLVFIIHALLF